MLLYHSKHIHHFPELPLSLYLLSCGKNTHEIYPLNKILSTHTSLLTVGTVVNHPADLRNVRCLTVTYTIEQLPLSLSPHPLVTVFPLSTSVPLFILYSLKFKNH